MRYPVVLEQEEDGGYVATVPTLPGCVSQGDTRAEALKNIKEAIVLHVEDCREGGDPVPTEAGKEFVEVEAARGRRWPQRVAKPQPICPDGTSAPRWSASGATSYELTIRTRSAVRARLRSRLCCASASRRGRNELPACGGGPGEIC